MALKYGVYEDQAAVLGWEPEEGVDTVCIPSEVNGVPVTQIGRGAFKDCQGIRTVVIPMTLEYIGNEAFCFCRDLTTVGVAKSDSHSVFPPKLEYIGEKAFCDTGLRELSFASNCLELGSLCFHDSTVTSAFFLGQHIVLRDGAFMSTELETVAMPLATIGYLPGNVFAFCENLRQFTAKRIDGIGENCFQGCSELTELPVRKPLRYVGAEAFRGCARLCTTGYFRTLLDAIRAWGDSYLIHETVKLKCPWASRMPEKYDGYCFRVSKAAREVLEKLRQIPCWEVTDLLLLNVIGSDYHGDGWDYDDRFLLYAKKDIRQRFRERWDWNLTGNLSLPEFRVPRQDIGGLTDQEVLRMVQYENSPQPFTLDWDDPAVFLNAELGGDAALYNKRMMMDVLSSLIDHEMGNTPEPYRELTPEQIREQCFGPEGDGMTYREKMDFLRWDVLYNRLAVYNELRYAYYQLTAPGAEETED